MRRLQIQLWNRKLNYSILIFCFFFFFSDAARSFFIFDVMLTTWNNGNPSNRVIRTRCEFRTKVKMDGIWTRLMAHARNMLQHSFARSLARCATATHTFHTIMTESRMALPFTLTSIFFIFSFLSLHVASSAYVACSSNSWKWKWIRFFFDLSWCMFTFMSLLAWWKSVFELQIEENRLREGKKSK